MGYLHVWVFIQLHARGWPHWYSSDSPKASGRVECPFDWPLFPGCDIDLLHDWLWNKDKQVTKISQLETDSNISNDCKWYCIDVCQYCSVLGTWEVQSVGVLGGVKLHDTVLIPAVILFYLLTGHRACSTWINLPQAEQIANETGMGRVSEGMGWVDGWRDGIMKEWIDRSSKRMDLWGMHRWSDMSCTSNMCHTPHSAR